MSMVLSSAIERPEGLSQIVLARLRELMGSGPGRLHLAALVTSLTVFAVAQISNHRTQPVEHAPSPARVATAAPAPAPANPWIEVRHPLKFYSLETAEFGREPIAYEARRRSQGNGREDTMVFGGSIPGEKRSLLISVYRRGKESEPEGRFFVELARQAARAGLSVVHAAQPGDLQTRFGAFEVADIALTTPTGEASCLGFRLNHDDPSLRISGYACGTAAQPFGRRELACTIDRLDLVAAGEDRELRRFFAASEQARGAGCGGARGTSKQRAAWLDKTGERPALRGEIGVRARP